MPTESEIKKMTVPDILARKKSGKKITALTAYDYLMAEMLDETGIDIILVGDSLGMVVSGYETTLPVTMEEMVYHTRIVSKGVKHALLVADMPFLSYQVSVEQAVANAGRFLKETAAQAVKVEGGRTFVPVVEKLVASGIPVMGHIGLLPQSIHKYGGYKLQGKDPRASNILKDDARRLADAGAFSLVLEKIPAELAREITAAVPVPTIGIGAGPHCDGQILVSHDMLGIYDKFKPRFVRRYAELGKEMRMAFKKYIDDIQSGNFPAEDESFS
ncbi:MAG: 3-methyl-2-oxobutanoate hydroxymethyltransferase [Calditrichaeota bacterium]|nr:3-methyl-2-oxobutanoate hydroxymethyltransferase [Calditrichota bacterium]RQW03175.1 MAG: 3-methyl-2-oxobutanoate hydroxymethyltransferase [Calditrichota bacterium]